MSKKTRKKSPKTAPKKASRAISKTASKKPAAKTGGASAKKSAKKSVKPASKASHKEASKKLKATVAEKSAPKPSSGGALTEGGKAPAFNLPRDGGGSVSLADYSGQKLVIFFYPRADTPGCTKEAIDFTRLSGAFAEAGTAVLGVSADPMKAQESFRDKHQLKTPLASDEKHAMLNAYGVWGEKSMYGRIFQGILRTTVLIGANGRIAKIWRSVKVDGHADEVLAAARAL